MPASFQFVNSHAFAANSMAFFPSRAPRSGEVARSHATPLYPASPFELILRASSQSATALSNCFCAAQAAARAEYAPTSFGAIRMASEASETAFMYSPFRFHDFARLLKVIGSLGFKRIDSL